MDSIQSEMASRTVDIQWVKGVRRLYVSRHQHLCTYTDPGQIQRDEIWSVLRQNGGARRGLNLGLKQEERIEGILSVNLTL